MEVEFRPIKFWLAGRDPAYVSVLFGSPKSSRTRNEPRVESESSEREPFVRLSDRALPLRRCNVVLKAAIIVSILELDYWNGLELE